MFERFTDGARRAIVLAQEECRIVGDDVIGTEYLLLGMLPDPDIQRVLDRAGASEDRTREHFADGRRAPRRSPVSGHIPFSPRAKRTLEGALRTSQRLDQDWIGTAHLLLSLLDQPQSSAVRILTAAGVDVDRLAAVADEVARQAPPPTTPGERRPPGAGPAADKSTAFQEHCARATNQPGSSTSRCSRTTTGWRGSGPRSSVPWIATAATNRRAIRSRGVPAACRRSWTNSPGPLTTTVRMTATGPLRTAEPSPPRGAATRRIGGSDPGG